MGGVKQVFKEGGIRMKGIRVKEKDVEEWRKGPRKRGQPRQTEE